MRRAQNRSILWVSAPRSSWSRRCRHEYRSYVGVVTLRSERRCEVLIGLGRVFRRAMAQDRQPRVPLMRGGRRPRRTDIGQSVHMPLECRDRSGSPPLPRHSRGAHESKFPSDERYPGAVAFGAEPVVEQDVAACLKAVGDERWAGRIAENATTAIELVLQLGR